MKKIAQRVLLSDTPFSLRTDVAPWDHRTSWPCRWIACPGVTEPPWVVAFRCRFAVARAEKVLIHVTADERYELFLDGQRIGRGPERGDQHNWFFESYDLSLTPGRHVLVARVWALGSLAPWAQITVQPGFLLASFDPAWRERLGTGVARWETKRLPGYTIVPTGRAFGGGYGLGFGGGFDVDGRLFAWNFERGSGADWLPVTPLHPGADAVHTSQIARIQLLRPAVLPAMLEKCRQVGRIRQVDARTRGPVRAAQHRAGEAIAWQRMLTGHGTVTIPARQTRRVLIDLENYYCAYPELVTSGGAGSRVRVHWQESLFNEPTHQTKPPRDEVEDKYFIGAGDVFRPDGGRRRRFESLWWRAGRYVELLVRTGNEPLVIEQLCWRETCYPLRQECRFTASDERLERLTPILTRSLQMCAHETYMDCPFYEQLMYVGDTRLEALTTYCLTRDARLPRKALQMFAASRLPRGLTRSNYPGNSTQIIPPFSLWWVAMLRDYAYWRDDIAFVRELLPAARGVVDTFLSARNAAGLIASLPGWNFMDWIPGSWPGEWPWGEPPSAIGGVSGVINWQVVLVLQYLADLENCAGEPVLANRARRLAKELADRVRAAFWVNRRGLFADDLAHQRFSEHAQSLAILAGERAPGSSLFTATGLTKPSIYFTHYIFEAYRELGRTDMLLKRMDQWFTLERDGFKTTYEADVPARTRSDCHAWGAHPLYHYFATILGIRPAAPGFAQVRIAPQLGPLSWAQGRLPHPLGMIEVELEQQGRRWHGQIRLPRGVTGTFVQAGRVRPLRGALTMIKENSK